jgi:mannitol/fructose-specific phosphotransferase system IIA component (Ntr-type)
MAEDEEVTMEDQIASVDATISALVDVLVKKGIITEKEFEQQLDTYYEEE